MGPDNKGVVHIPKLEHMLSVLLSMKSPATTGERGDLIAVLSVGSKKQSLYMK